MNKSEQINELASALSKMQGELENAYKDSSGYGFKYADLSQVLSIIRPLLTKNGLCFTQPVSIVDDKVVVTTLVIHTSGQWISSDLALSPVPSKSMNSAQQVGTAISYARRYSLNSFFGIHADTDDQNAQVPDYIKEAEKNAVKLIESSQVLTLSQMLFESKVSQEDFCAKYNIAQLQMLPLDKYGNAINRLQATIDKNKASKPTPEDYMSV